MLRIKRIKKYTRAKYPKGNYFEKPQNGIWKFVRSGATQTALLALLSSCQGIGMAGPPPVAMDIITENEARTIIKQVFEKHGIKLEEDVPYIYTARDGKQVELNLDGYNSTLKVGYEYLSEEDRKERQHFYELQRLGSFDESYIRVLHTEAWEAENEHSHVYAKKVIEHNIEEFIANLRATGLL